MVHLDCTFAAGLPPMMTLVLPLAMRPICAEGATNAPSTMPGCGGVLTPAEPNTAAALPPMITVFTRSIVSGAENGSGPAGCVPERTESGGWSTSR